MLIILATRKLSTGMKFKKILANIFLIFWKKNNTYSSHFLTAKNITLIIIIHNYNNSFNNIWWSNFKVIKNLITDKFVVKVVRFPPPPPHPHPTPPPPHPTPTPSHPTPPPPHPPTQPPTSTPSPLPQVVKFYRQSLRVLTGVLVSSSHCSILTEITLAR